MKHSFFDINYTVFYTWIVMLILVIILIPVYIVLKRKKGLFHFMITNFVNYFSNLTTQSLGYFSFNHFAFVSTIFIFILCCNMISILPWMEEPTRDINTTLSLGAVQFLYIQFYSIKAHGFWNYLKEYFEPFFPMFPLNVVGKFATIISISFRLFGNIFGGVIISKIFLSSIEGGWLSESFGLIMGIPIKLVFGLFEGFLQAFVFTMLTITYLSIGLQNSHSPESKSGETA
ncbi:F0F1 ATP synthase subunit A [Candidatus Dependentiae bacterium]